MRFWIILTATTSLAMPALAQQPTQAQASAIRSSCRGDYQTYCASVPTGGQASLQCLQQNVGSVSSGCRQALAAVSGGGAPSGTPPAGGGTMPAPAPMPPLSPRQEMMVLRTSCSGDYRAFCRGVPMGGGRVIGCLRAAGPSLSPRCRSALMSMQGTR